MHNEKELHTLIGSLHSSLKLQAALMAKFEQSEASMQTKVNGHLQAMHDGISRISQQTRTIVDDTSSRIADDTAKTFSPIATRFGHELSLSLHSMRKLLSIWCMVAGAILLLSMLFGWMTLGHYRQELAAARVELQRHENAIPILEAYAASDATLCDGRICVNIDERQRLGHKPQYRQAKPRRVR